MKRGRAYVRRHCVALDLRTRWCWSTASVVISPAQLTGTDPPGLRRRSTSALPFHVDAIERIEVHRAGHHSVVPTPSPGVIGIVLHAITGALARRSVWQTRRWWRQKPHQLWAMSPARSAKTASSTSASIGAGRPNQRGSQRGRLASGLFPNGDARNWAFNKQYGQWGQSTRDNWTAQRSTPKWLGDDKRACAPGWANYADKLALNYVNQNALSKRTRASRRDDLLA